MATMCSRNVSSVVAVRVGRAAQVDFAAAPAAGAAR